MHVTLHQLRLLRAVADNGTISRAAQRMHITQAALSLQLRDLADSAGQPLFDRVGRGLRINAAGEAVVRAAQDVADALERMQTELAQLQGLERGRLRIAAATTAEYFVPRLLGEFHRRRPGIDIELTVANRAQVLARLTEHRDDLYLMARPPEALDLADVPIMENPLVVIAPQDHALAGRRRIDLARLLDEPFVMREEGSGTRLIADAWLRGHGHALTARLALGSNEAIKKAVAHGLGLAIVSRHAVEDEAREGIRVLDVRGLPIPSHWHLVYPRARRLSPPAAAFVEYSVESGKR